MNPTPRKVIALHNVPVDALTPRHLKAQLRAALQRIEDQHAALEEAGAEIDRLRAQLDEIEAMLPTDPKGRALPARVRGVLGALADAVELLDPETRRAFPSEGLRDRRARLLRLLPRLGPYRPADSRRSA